jgi:hypothetical protein
MSRKSSTNDYRFKSSMFCKNSDLWISGRSFWESDIHGEMIFDQLITS